MSIFSLPDSQARRSRWLTYGLAALFLAACFGVALFLFGRLIGFVVCVPILGAFVARLVVNHGAAGYQGFRWLALREFNGSYHAFDDLHVRVEWDVDQCRVMAEDVFNVMRERADAKARRRLCVAHGEQGFFQDERGTWWFGEAAVLAWLSHRAQRFDVRAQRFHHWFEKEVFPPMRNKAEIRARGLVLDRSPPNI
jgi:hypothetical protein